MSRPLRDRQNHASQQHFYLLSFLAVKALRLYPNPNVSVEDLITVGWYGQLRRVPENKLHGLSNNVLRAMYAYIREEKQKTSVTFTSLACNIYTVTEESPLLRHIMHKDQVDALLSILPKESVSLLKKYYVQGKTFQEIGEDIGMTRQGVQQRMQKILSLLRDEAEKQKESIGNNT